MTRDVKRASLEEVSAYCSLPVAVIRQYESHPDIPLDFLTWVCLASYFGRTMLQTPFIIHHLEWPVAETYFMYLKNGEPVQYSAKKAVELIQWRKI
jgi:hypothetical protein